jgi:hypothetical protein
MAPVEIPADVLASQDAFAKARFVKAQIPEYDAQALTTLTREADHDRQLQDRVNEHRQACDRVRTALAELGREDNDLHSQRGRRLVAGEDCREIDKQIRQAQEHGTRLRDELVAREAYLEELAREAAKVHYDFILARCAAFAAIVTGLAFDAQAAKSEWEVRVALHEAAKQRLDQYNEGVRLAQIRTAEVCGPKESVPA